jgi:hypothetical protein
MQNRISHLVLAASVALLATAGPATAALTDSQPHPPSNYYSFQPPLEGQSYTDPVFGTSIKRLSNALSTPDAAMGSGYLEWVMTEYSTMAAFNSDNSRFLLQHGSYFALYDGSGNYLRDLPFDIYASAQPRWSRTSNSVVYFVNGNRVRSFDVATNTLATIRTFTEYGSISGAGESDNAFAGNKLVLAGDGHAIFVYDIATNTKSPVFDTAGKGGWDAIYLTPDGNVLLTWLAGNGGRYTGIELFNGNMVFQRQVAPVGGHMDVTRDTTGAEVLVWTESSDPTPVCASNGMVKVRLSDASASCLLSLSWSLAIHASCPDNAGFCIVETYAPSDPSPSGSWPAYANELLRVPLDGSATSRLAHHRSRPLNGYNYTPRATVSRDGTKLLFSSNFGLQDQLNLPTEYSDAYLITLAGSGSSGGGGSTPPPPTSTTTRVQDGSSKIAYSGSWYLRTSRAYSGGTARNANASTAKATFTFNGTGVRWIGRRAANGGYAYVYVDGVYKGKIDCYASSAKSKVGLYTITGLPAGSHKIEIRVRHEKRAASSNFWVWLDAFDVFS